MSDQDTRESTTGSSAVAVLLQMITGYWPAQVVYVAAKLRIADLLKDGPKNSDELAAASQTHGPSLVRLLRVLVGLGVFAEGADGRFALTPLGACLQNGAPGSVRAAALMFGETLYRTWGGLLHSVQTGEPAWGQVLGMPIYHFAQHPDDAAVFNEAMIAMTTQVAAAVVAAYDFSRFRTLVDVGGGHGTLTTAVLRATPALKGVVFDVPKVADGARKYLEAGGLAGRCTVMGGDFFASVPGGGDAYILKSIITCVRRRACYPYPDKLSSCDERERRAAVD